MRYYVWVNRGTETRPVPLRSEGYQGPYSLDQARAYARIGASKGRYGRIVSSNTDPAALKVVRVYAPGFRRNASGEAFQEPTSEAAYLKAWFDAEIAPALQEAAYEAAPGEAPRAKLKDQHVKFSVPGLDRDQTEALVRRLAQRGQVDSSFYVSSYPWTFTATVSPPQDVLLRAVAAGTEMVRLRLVALLCNPKTLEMWGAYWLDEDRALLAVPLAHGELDLDSSARHTADVMGIGHISTEDGTRGDRWVDGCPRAHTPSGVREKEKAYGTLLYTALTVVAALATGVPCVGSAPDSPEYGARLKPADDWWAENTQPRKGRLALATAIDLEDLDPQPTGGSNSEDVDDSGNYTLSRHQQRSIEQSIREELYESDSDLEGIEVELDSDEIGYSYTATRPVEGLAQGVAGFLTLSSCIDQGLVLWADLELPEGNLDTATANELLEKIQDAHAAFLTRFAAMDPMTEDPEVLALLREILISGGIDPAVLAEWDATYGQGGRGTEFLFAPAAPQVTRRLEPQQMRSRGFPAGPGPDLRQRTLPFRNNPSRRRPAYLDDPAVQAELAALNAGWDDDVS